MIKDYHSYHDIYHRYIYIIDILVIIDIIDKTNTHFKVGVIMKRSSPLYVWIRVLTFLFLFLCLINGFITSHALAKLISFLQITGGKRYPSLIAIQ